MKIKRYIAGPIDANNYLVWDEKSKEAVLIDCSDYREDILADIKKYGLNVKYILLTHGHFDHVLGVNQMKQALSANVGIHKDDIVMLENINEFRNYLPFDPVKVPKYDFNIKDGDKYTIGTTEVNVISTPGHTLGGVCYLIDNSLFSGDTLFKGCYGRTDLFGGNYNQIKNSISDRLFKLADNVKVYPGHGEFSDIGYEKKYNEINN